MYMHICIYKRGQTCIDEDSNRTLGDCIIDESGKLQMSRFIVEFDHWINSLAVKTPQNLRDLYSPRSSLIDQFV